MATNPTGWFDKNQTVKGWFDTTLEGAGWFDETAITVTTGGGTNYTLTAQAGSFSVSGISAAISRNRNLTASVGTYTFAGVSATILRKRSLTAAAGAYTFSGVSAAVSRGRSLVPSAGAYSLDGKSATITYTPGAVNYTLTAQTGTFSLAGQPATILRSKLVAGQGGAYSVAGVSSTVKVGRYLSAQPGAYAFAGQSAVITYTPLATSGYTITCLSGSFAVSAASSTITVAVPSQRRGAGNKRLYEIKGKRYWLTPQELEQLIAQMLGELNRNDVVDAENKIITRRAWSKIQNSIKQAESRLEFKLPIETVVIEDEDDDEEALLMLI